MAEIQLTEGAIKAFETERSSEYPNPILQIISQIKEIVSNSTGPQKQTRYRAVVSDGPSTINVFFATQLNPLIESKTVDRFSVIKVKQYQVNPINDSKLLLIILDMEILVTLKEKLVQRSAPSSEFSTDKPPLQEEKSHVSEFQQKISQNQNQNQNQYQRPPNPGSTMKNESYGNNSFNGFRGQGVQNNSMGQQQGAPQDIFPIRNINPYQNKWTIRARVSQKSDVRTWSNQKGTGRLFSIVLIDESGEIKATGFNDSVDQYYNMLEVGKVYYVSGARVNMSNPKFNQTKNEYELVLENHSTIVPCADNISIPQTKYSFVKLNKLGDFDKDKLVDVLVVVAQVGEISDITSKTTNKTIQKRDLTVVDDSMYSVRLTLWGANAVQFNMHDNPILAFKNVRVNDFGGRSLSTLSTSSMVANIDIPEAYPLRSWYDGQGKMAHFQSYAGGGGSLTAGQGGDELKTISQVKEENLGNGDKPDYFTIDANIIFIKSENLAYPACPSESCNKKVVLDSSSQLWHCEQCQKGFPSPKYRYIMSMSASDTTGNLWLQCFDDTGSVVLGTSANEIMELHDSNREEFDARINRRNFLKYRFRCRAKSEVYNDTSRVRYTVVSISEIDFVAESMRKFKIIESY